MTPAQAATPVDARMPAAWRGYLLAVMLAGIALAASLAMQAMIGGRLFIMPFFPAMIAVALYAGVGPAIVCSLIALLAVLTAWRGGWGASSALRIADAWTLAMFVLSAGLIMIIAARLRRAEQRRSVLLVLERQAREEAERAGRMKDEFLATLSHDGAQGIA